MALTSNSGPAPSSQPSHAPLGTPHPFQQSSAASAPTDPRHLVHSNTYPAHALPADAGTASHHDVLAASLGQLSHIHAALALQEEQTHAAAMNHYSQVCQHFSSEPLLATLASAGAANLTTRYHSRTAEIQQVLGRAEQALRETIIPQPRRRRNLAPGATRVLQNWLHENAAHPYATEQQRKQLALQAGITTSQVANWISNRRSRDAQRVARIRRLSISSVATAPDSRQDSTTSPHARTSSPDAMQHKQARVGGDVPVPQDLSRGNCPRQGNHTPVTPQ